MAPNRSVLESNSQCCNPECACEAPKQTSVPYEPEEVQIGAFLIGVCAAIALIAILFAGCATAPAVVAQRWYTGGPVPVYADPGLSPQHRAALDAAVEAVDSACECRAVLRPVTGAPVLRQEIPGAPDRGTIYVRDDGGTHPERAETTVYSFPGNGAIFSAEIVLPRDGLDRNWFVRSYTAGELRAMALHEVAHALGLPHNPDRYSAMHRSGVGAVGLSTADAAELRRRYGGL